MGKQGSDQIDKIVLLHHVRCMAAVQVICIVVFWFMIRRMSRRNRHGIPVDVAGIRKAYYDKLVDIHGLDREVGDHSDIASETQSEDSTEKIENLDSQNEISSENNQATNSGNANVHKNVGGSENAQKSGEQSGSIPKRSAENCWEGSSSKKAKTRGNKINVEGVDILKQGFEKVAKAILNSTSEFEKLKHFPIDESEIWTYLEELNLHGDLIRDAYVFLSCNPEKLRAFLGCPVERRRDVLRAMMRIP